MKVDVLISCMNQVDGSIVDKSNLNNANVVVVNQNKEKECIEKISDRCTFVHTTSRGLSVSRNIAIEHSNADICLLSDDDEVFVDGVCDIVKNAYEKYVDADVIVFKIENRREKFKGKVRKLSKVDTMKISSIQISFKRNSVKNIRFDENIGSGTPNGSGEENKFLLDCKKNGLRIIYVPIVIAKIIENSGSMWFDGYNERYFYNHGRTTRYVYGFAFALMYSIYFVIVHKKEFENFSRIKAFKFIVKGVFSNDIANKKT